MENNKIKIIIVDDDDQDLQSLTVAIEKFSRDYKVEFDLSVYHDSVKFVQNVQNVTADIIFLDIYMPNMTGMEVAHKLREVNQSIHIIFYTNMAQYAVEGYSVNAMDFLLKPIQYDGLKRALNRAVLAIENTIKRNVCINDKVTKKMVVLPMDEIIYVEVGKHCLTYHTTQGVYEEWNSLKAVAEQLSHRYFGRCHASFLVGFKYILAIRGDDIFIKENGSEKVLPISRSYKKEFLISFANYMRS